jgi:two-component system phosphate regulon sensor histidine kinase PhoR
MSTNGSGDTADTGSRKAGRRWLRRGVLVACVVGLVALLVIFMVALDRRLEADLLEDHTSSLVTDAQAVRRALPSEEGDALVEATVALSRELGERITVIRSDGVVLADSERNTAVIENHAARPEVRRAMTGVIGVSSRLSETVERPLRYVALPPENGRIVRVADSTEHIASRVQGARTLVGITAVVGLAIGTVGALVLLNQLPGARRRARDDAAVAESPPEQGPPPEKRIHLGR